MGTVTAGGLTFTTFTAWEASVGTAGGPTGGTCTAVGSFDDGGIVLDYTSNVLEDLAATYNYIIKGSSGTVIAPTTVGMGGAAGTIIEIVTDTTMMDITLDGVTARENDEWYTTGVNINLNSGEDAKLFRVKAIGMGEFGGGDSVGFKCDDQHYNDINIWGCYATDIVASGGNNAYGVSVKQTTPPNFTNKPEIVIEFCTVDSIRSYNDTSSATNEAIGFFVSDASGYNLRHCVSHGISAGNGYIGGDSLALCYGPGHYTLEPRHNFPHFSVRGTYTSNQSSDRTGHYVGLEDEINLYTGPNERPFPLLGEAKGIYNRRPDPEGSGFFNCANRIHDLKIARYLDGSPVPGMQINNTHKANSIGAFGTYIEISIGTGDPASGEPERAYSSIASALTAVSYNPRPPSATTLTLTDTGYYRYGYGYMLGHSAFGHVGPTYMILRLFGDGAFNEQLKLADIPDTIGTGTASTGGAIGPLSSIKGWVFTSNPYNRAKIIPGYEGYSDTLFDAGDHLVQHLEIDAEHYGWGIGISAKQVHNCIVHGDKPLAPSESIQTGISANYVTGPLESNPDVVGAVGGTVTTCLVYGTIRNGISASRAYSNTVVLNNMSLTGAGLTADYGKNNLVLTSGTNLLITGGNHPGSGNIGDSRNRVNDYFTNAANDDYNLKRNSLAIDRGVIPVKHVDYGDVNQFLPIWPYELTQGSGNSTAMSNPSNAGYNDQWDGNHWFLDGGMSGLAGGEGNRFVVAVSQSTFDTGWDENSHGEYIAPQAPFIAFMDF
jgi:hypothetical protein